MKANELREMTGDDLNARLKDLREELFRLRFQATTGQLENTCRIREARREVARILTILRDKQSAGEAPVAG